jgi:hypothetical protein
MTGWDTIYIVLMLLLLYWTVSYLLVFLASLEFDRVFKVLKDTVNGFNERIKEREDIPMNISNSISNSTSNSVSSYDQIMKQKYIATKKRKIMKKIMNKINHR